MRSALLTFAVICLYASAASAQQQPPPAPRSDVIKTETSLIQTDITVFDAHGNFVDGLKQDQFTLKIDGKPRPISFFERVQAGSSNEEAQLSAARGLSSGSRPAAAVPLDRGRTVLFFVDDFHLSTTSMHEARRLLSHFIDNEMTQNDEAEIASAAGQLGFLQQMTGSKAVLRKAVDRLSARNFSRTDSERPPMSEHQAELIEQNDDNIIGYFVDALVRDGIPRDAAERTVHARASDLLNQSAHYTVTSLATLRSLVRMSAEVPGRKILFFIGDGFFLINGSSDITQRLREITAEAARAGVVIYSLDARGLNSGIGDASRPGEFDPTGRLQSAAIGELAASREGMNTLAVDTGGRVLFNTNDASQAVTKALKETSTYYLLAWRPQNDEQKNAKRRVEVGVIGKPELIVRYRRVVGSSVDSLDKTNAEPARPFVPLDALNVALRSSYPKNDLAVHLLLNFLNVPRVGTILATSMSVPTDSLALEPINDIPTALIDIGGVVLDERGNAIKAFSKKLTVKALKGINTPPQSISYNDSMPIKPGLYQVRVAALDEKQQRVGSAIEWIEVPNLDSKTLALSSLIVAEKISESENANSAPAVSKETNPFANLRLNVDHHFARSSHLRFLSFIYNAMTSNATTSLTSPNNQVNAPDLAVQLQVFRDDQPVLTEPVRKIQIETADLARVPYAADVSLVDLQPGRYVLQVTIIDRLAKASASQRFNFQID